MNASIRIIKRRARFALKEAMGVAILGVLLELAISLGGAYICSSLFPGTDFFSLVLYQVFAFIVSLITSLFSAGLSYMYLNIARKEPYSAGDLLFFFRNNPDRVLVASFCLSLIQLLTMMPYYVYQFTYTEGETLQEQLAFRMTILVLMLAGQIIYILISIPFALTYYLMADDRELGGFEALRKSADLMRGAKGKFFFLLVSFIPMLFLCVLLFYLPLLWVIPHLFMCEVIFYELRLHPEMDYREEAWPKQAPEAYVNPFLTGEMKAPEEGIGEAYLSAAKKESGEMLLSEVSEPEEEGSETGDESRDEEDNT